MVQLQNMERDKLVNYSHLLCDVKELIIEEEESIKNLKFVNNLLSKPSPYSEAGLSRWFPPSIQSKSPRNCDSLPQQTVKHSISSHLVILIIMMMMMISSKLKGKKYWICLAEQLLSTNVLLFKLYTQLSISDFSARWNIVFKLIEFMKVFLIFLFL